MLVIVVVIGDLVVIFGCVGVGLSGYCLCQGGDVSRATLRQHRQGDSVRLFIMFFRPCMHACKHSIIQLMRFPTCMHPCMHPCMHVGVTRLDYPPQVRDG